MANVVVTGGTSGSMRRELLVGGLGKPGRGYYSFIVHICMMKVELPLTWLTSVQSFQTLKDGFSGRHAKKLLGISLKAQRILLSCPEL